MRAFRAFVRDHRDQHLVRAADRGAAFLDQAFDRNPGIAHRGSDLGQHAGPVGDGEAEIGVAHAVAGLGGAIASSSATGIENGAAPPVIAARDVDQVGDHCARGRPVARARALEQQPAGEIAFRHHRIGRAVDMGERMIAVDQDAGGRAGTAARSPSASTFGLGHADQADVIAQRIGLRRCRRRARGGCRWRRPARNRRRCRRRSRARIASLCAASTPSMSKLGSALGIALGLRLGEHVGEIAAGVLHRREDVIAGAVEDAVDPRRSRWPLRLRAGP